MKQLGKKNIHRLKPVETTYNLPYSQSNNITTYDCETESSIKLSDELLHNFRCFVNSNSSKKKKKEIQKLKPIETIYNIFKHQIYDCQTRSLHQN